MKKIVQTIGVLLLCGALCCPVMDARGRNDGNGGNSPRPSTGQQSRPSRPGNSGQGHGNSSPSRPTKPANNSQNRPTKPGNSGHHRPGHGNNNQYRPETGHRPGGPGHRPSHGHNHNHSHYYRPTPPSRPYLPPSRPYYRPAPPRSWRPAPGWRPFRTVLGVTFGSGINVSLNLLLNSGYTIQSYGPDAIYLSNVPMMNYYWPDATMYYNNGALAGSEFVYYTPYANSSRYDLVFNALCGSYGAPVSVVNNGGVVTASWWGAGNQYISLSYGGQYAGNGTLGYYTTLTFGI